MRFDNKIIADYKRLMRDKSSHWKKERRRQPDFIWIAARSPQMAKAIVHISNTHRRLVLVSELAVVGVIINRSPACLRSGVLPNSIAQ